MPVFTVASISSILMRPPPPRPAARRPRRRLIPPDPSIGSLAGNRPTRRRECRGGAVTRPAPRPIRRPVAQGGFQARPYNRGEAVVSLRRAGRPSPAQAGLRGVRRRPPGAASAAGLHPPAPAPRTSRQPVLGQRRRVERDAQPRPGRHGQRAVLQVQELVGRQ